MGCGFSSPNDAVVQQPTTTTAPSKVSPVYKSLPKGAQKFPVRNVYDGDTLTLVDERRVRFLGIDTPELAEKQPFAQEAKDYAKDRCHKKDIFLVIEGKDHYGRLLAWIYVPHPSGGYESVNEGLIQQGLAFVYIVKKDEKPFNWDKLLTLQSQARATKRGVWKTFKDEAVVATANGSAYHKRSCSHLANVKHLTDYKVSQAADLGLHPCRTCMA